ncbi:MAG: hypothetical protein AB1634_07190 [Thermodesulfobacteriota bacterium]
MRCLSCRGRAPLVILLFLCLLPLRASGETFAGYTRLGRLALDAPTALAVAGDESLSVVQANAGRLAVYGPEGSQRASRSDLDQPSSVAVAPDGSILVGCSGDGSVRVYTPDLVPVRQLGRGAGEVRRPLAIAVSASGTIYVADALANAIKVYGADGSWRFSFGSPGREDGQFNYPTAITILEERQEMVVVDLCLVDSPTGTHPGARLQVFDLEGQFLRQFGGFGLGAGVLIKPTGVAADGDGDLLVVDAYQGVVQLFDALGIYQGAVYDTSTPLRTPLDVGIGVQTGRLFVADAAGIEVFGLPGSVHTVTAGAAGRGHLAPAGAVTVADGAAQDFLLAADEGYAIAGLEVDGVAVAGVGGLTRTVYTLPAVEADHVLAVTFAPQVHTVRATAQGHGRLSPEGVLSVAHGGQVAFTLSPEPGYRVGRLLVDGVEQGAASQYVLGGIAGDHTVEATFVAPESVAIWAGAGAHGSIVPSGTVTRAEGDSATFTIAPEPGYTIADVLVDGIAAGPVDRYTFVALDRDHSIEALFLAAPVWHDLVVTVAGAGAVASGSGDIACPPACTAELAQGSPVALAASPGAGQVFVGWGGDCTGSDPVCRLVMTGQRAVTAHFGPDRERETFELGHWRAFPWLTGGASAWTIQDQVPHQGRYAAQAPIDLAAGGMSFLEVALEVPQPGEIRFWLRLRDTTGSDQLSFLLDGVEAASWAGDLDWQEAWLPVPAGRHVFRWEYRKRDGDAAASAWLDDIVFPLHVPPPAPVPDLKANGSDGPMILRRGQPLVVSYGLAAGAALGQGSDWLLALHSPWGWFFYDQTRQVWSPRPALIYQGPLADGHAHTTFLATTGLPPGGYIFYFLVDRTADGQLDQDLALDAVQVRVGR